MRIIIAVMMFAACVAEATDLTMVPDTGDMLTMGKNEDGKRVKIAEAPTGYLRGFWPTYLNSTTLVIQAGEGWIGNGIYCTDATVTTQAISTLSTSIDQHYFYFDSSASTVTNAVFYDSLTECTTWDGRSHVNSTNLEDRLAFSVYSWSNAAAVVEFFMSGNEMHLFTNDVNSVALRVGFQMDPDNFWQTPFDSLDSGGVEKPTPPRIPVNASDVRIHYGNNRTVSGIATFVMPKELTNSLPNSADITAGSFVKSFGFFERQAQFVSDWFPVGPSREFFIRGTDAGLNQQAMTITAFRQRR